MPKKTREKLLGAGRSLFASVGYENASVGDLEKAAGLTPRAGGFYRHFKSKAALLLALAESTVETPVQVGFDSVLPLEDTRAELIHIARSYQKLDQPQDGFANVIHAEAVRIPELAQMIKRANTVMFEVLLDWLKSKPIAKNTPEQKLVELVFIIFGGWLFFLDAQNRVSLPHAFKSDSLLKSWAAHWGPVLDQES